MADAFAPQLSTEVRFNQPVETQAAPSALGALADLGSMFVQSFGQARQSAASSSAASSTDPNLVVFQQGLERVEAIRQERGESAAQIAERQLAKNFAAAGIRLGPEFEDTYVTTTGRPWQGYGMDVEANMLQETLKDPEVQASYIASYAVNRDWSEEQRVEYAIGQKAQLEAQKQEISRAQSDASYKWTIQTEAAYSGAVDTFVNRTFGALAASSSEGVTVGPQEIANLQAQWAQYKMGLTRPSGVSDDQWKATQDKISSVDATLAAFEKAGSNETLLNEITSAFARTMIREGEGSPTSFAAAMVAIKDQATLINLAEGRVETFLMETGKNLQLNVTPADLFGHIVTDQGTLSDPDPNAFLKELPAAVKGRIEGKTPQQIFDGLNASGQLTSVVKPQDLGRPEAREQFVENAATIGAVIQNNKENEFLSPDFIKKLVGNPQFVANVKALEAVDPEGAAVARTYVRSGLNTEKGRQQRNLEAIEANLGVTWNGSLYVLDPQALMTKNGWTQQQAQGFVNWVGKTYGGDLRKLVDGLAPMPEGMPFQPVALKQAYDRRNAIGVIDQTMKALEVPVEPGQEAQAATTTTPGGYRLPEEVAQDQEFVGAVNTLATDFNISPDDVFRVIEFETAGSWSPSIKNPNSTATGLIQFLESTAKGLGTSTSQLASMTRAQQMEYVRKYLEPFKGRINNFGDLYLAIHYPVAVGKSETFVMYREGSDEYRANRNLDTNGDGTVTRGETVASVIARTGGGRGVMTTPATAQTSEFLTAVNADIQEAAPPGGFTPAPAAPVQTPVAPVATSSPTSEAPAVDAALPEQVEQEQQPTQASQEEAARNAPPVDQEVAALIQEIAGNPDKEFASERDLLAAQQRGELEPGDTIIVDGIAYMVRKDGTAKRLGAVQ